MNIFKLAELQLLREGKNNFTDKELLSKAIFIRKWLDKHRQSIADKILAGGKVYQYNNRIVVL